MGRNLTRIIGCFEQTVPRYVPVEFNDLQTPLSNKEKNIRNSLGKLYRPFLTAKTQKGVTQLRNCCYCTWMYG